MSPAYDASLRLSVAPMMDWTDTKIRKAYFEGWYIFGAVREVRQDRWDCSEGAISAISSENSTLQQSCGADVYRAIYGI